MLSVLGSSVQKAIRASFTGSERQSWSLAPPTGALILPQTNVWAGSTVPALPQPWSGCPKINSPKYHGAPLLGMRSVESIVRQSPNYGKLTQLVRGPVETADSDVKEVICRSRLLLIVTETETTHCSAACLP